MYITLTNNVFLLLHNYTFDIHKCMGVYACNHMAHIAWHIVYLFKVPVACMQYVSTVVIDIPA